MMHQTAERLDREFGARCKETKYIIGWEPRTDVGVALERGRAKEEFAWVWVPHPGEGWPIPEGAVEYAPDRGRNSNTYSLAGLKKGMPALRVRIESPSQLEELVWFIHRLPPIGSRS